MELKDSCGQRIAGQPPKHSVIALLHRIAFRVRQKEFAGIQSKWRMLYFRLLGMRVGRHTYLGRLAITWPHQVAVGTSCIVENDVCFKFDGIYRRGASIVIGNDCFIGRGVEFNIREGIRVGDGSFIASGCRFVDHDHGFSRSCPIREQPGRDAPIEIGPDCWIAANVVVLKAVKIGQGAVVGAGAVVTKSVPPYEIWAGIPATKINTRK